MDELTKIVLTAVLSFLSGAAAHWLRLRLDPTARLIWAPTNKVAFGIDAQKQTIAQTQSVLIQNNGRAPAEQVEIVLAFRPMFFQLSPPREITEVRNDTHYIVKVPHLGPGERLTVEMMQVGRLETSALPVVSDVRSKAGTAREVPVAPQRTFPKWAYATSATLLLIGTITVAFALGFAIFKAGRLAGAW